jgi:O-antigen ligase
MLANKGYDPLTRIMQTATYATDIKNPDWDKGRSISQGIAIKAWEKNIWFGAGYDELFHYGLPEEVATAHNGIITSLFHRGIVGTTLLLLIFFMTYKNAIKLWRISMLKKTYEYDLYKLLILVAFLWLIPFMTQEALWEKYSFCIQLMYLGIITNIYAQQFAFTKSISLKNKEVSYQI